MRRILKSKNEPACLAGVRREAIRIEKDSGKEPKSEDWDLKLCATPVRELLASDQGGLCAYCCGRISSAGYGESNPSGMKIEHFRSRKDHPREMYDWPNLLGVCGGRHVWGGEIHRTCDEVRGSTPLHTNPATSRDLSSVFIPSRNGTLVGATSDAAKDIVTLNLSAEVLVQNRAGVIFQLQQRLAKDDSRANIQRLLQVVTTPPFEPYSFVAEWYLRRKLASHPA
jgi:uncharacterized protein (TIGR02646 family)